MKKEERKQMARLLLLFVRGMAEGGGDHCQLLMQCADSKEATDDDANKPTATWTSYKLISVRSFCRRRRRHFKGFLFEKKGVGKRREI